MSDIRLGAAAVTAAGREADGSVRAGSDVLAGDYPTIIVKLDAKRRLTITVGLAPASPGDYFDVRFDVEEDALYFGGFPVRKAG